MKRKMDEEAPECNTAVEFSFPFHSSAFHQNLLLIFSMRLFIYMYV